METHNQISDELDLMASQILSEHWGMSDQPERVVVGVNKQTWKVGNRWLTCAFVHQVEDVAREFQLYASLSERSTHQEALDVPAPVPSKSHSTVQAYDRVWWMTNHVPGRQPDPKRFEDTIAIVKGLARLHKWLSPLPKDSSVKQEDMIALFKQGVALSNEPKLQFSKDVLELLDVAALVVNQYLLGRDFDQQLIHGDPSNPNLRVSEEMPVRLTGALDWECCRYDSPISDLSTVGQTVVFRSGTSDPLADLVVLLKEYNQTMGSDFELKDLLVFMIMGKFESIAHHGGRFLRGEISEELVQSQPEKIRVLLELLKSEMNRTTER